MKNIYRNLLIIVFILIILTLLIETIILIKKGDTIKDAEENNEKVYYEIKYLDKKIIYMAGILNNENINWNELIDSSKYIYNYWNSAILDLSTAQNIDKNLLIEFGRNLDELTVSFINHEKNSSLYYLSTLYNKLISYYQRLNYDDIYESILNAEYNLLLASIAANDENWTSAYENVIQSNKYLLKVVNDLDTKGYNQYNINQAYIATKELENIINVKNIEIFKLKYNIAIEKIENI